MKDSLEKIPNYKIQLANEIISFWYNVSQEQWFYIGLFLPPIFLVIMLSITFERSQNTVINSMINIFGKYTLIAIMVLFSVAATSIAHIYFNYPEEFDKYLNNVFEMAENVLSKSVLYSIVGCGLLSIVGYRYTSPLLNKLLIKLTRKSITEYKIPETRDLKKIFNKSMEYDPFPYFESAKEKNAIFLGLNSNKKPILVHRKKWCSSHGTIQGETGAGKGVAASIQLAQSITFGDFCIIFAPKEDEWANSVYQEICSRTGTAFNIVDCRQGTPPQINPLKSINEYDLYELLISCFDLSRQGGDADHYRNHDRKGAKIISKLCSNHSSINLPLLYEKSYELLGEFSKKCEGLLSQLEEISDLSSVQTNEGVNLEQLINDGGCLIIQGSTRDESVQTLVKMLLIRIIQITENRKSKARHITIFCDEVKYLLCHTLINSFGTLRDKNANFIITYQSISDLEDSTASLNPVATRNSILDNTAIKWIYRSRNFEVATWVSNLAGKKNDYEALINTSSNLLIAEKQIHSRVLRPIEAPVIHTNEVQNLPDFCGICIGSDDLAAQIAYTSVIKVKKIPTSLRPALQIVNDDHGELL